MSFGSVDGLDIVQPVWGLSRILSFRSVNAHQLVFSSDSEKKILQSVDRHFSAALHSWCVLHLMDSYKKAYKSLVLICQIHRNLLKFWSGQLTSTMLRITIRK